MQCDLQELRVNTGPRRSPAKMEKHRTRFAEDVAAADAGDAFHGQIPGRVPVLAIKARMPSTLASSSAVKEVRQFPFVHFIFIIFHLSVVIAKTRLNYQTGRNRNENDWQMGMKK